MNEGGTKNKDDVIGPGIVGSSKLGMDANTTISHC